ncbi:MAG: cupin domain-containing protein [Deltaproteobacteria bacterium]|nr:cupin domain-containing protein [Deltaproteobacteria bacterium]
MKKRTFLNGVIVVCLGLLFLTTAPAKAANTTEQILTQIDDILKVNPLSPTDKVQMINIAQDDTITINVARLIEGAEVKPHFHKTHDEMVYVLKGSGQMFVNGKWINVKPGTFHFNPMNKVHSTKNTGKEPLVIFSIFTPSMKEMDRYFVDIK